MSIHILRAFFLEGRKPNGSYMGATEHAVNATERNLSCLTDADLLAHRDGALEFIRLINAEYASRECEQPEPEPGPRHEDSCLQDATCACEVTP